ncbi:MAG: hypothetical protein GXP51_05035 [Deltaproteobacteria bacterium]|nr:hypothetical protein [Deltaproteobacteria bacterium]
MNETVTVNYASEAAMKNAVADLLGAGIPQDKFFVDDGKLQIKVITPTDSKPEIVELLNRHTTK